MSPLGELLAIDQRSTLEFFVTGLQDVSDGGIDRQELLYNASVLAHYALVSTQSTTEMPAPASLTGILDQFVLDETVSADGEMLETAAAQCLLLAGFFEDQARRRHSIRWYAQLGASFFIRAAAQQRAPRKAELLTTLACHFEAWRLRHARLGRELRQQPYLLPIAKVS
jgi:hypothetical protein